MIALASNLMGVAALLILVFWVLPRIVLTSPSNLVEGLLSLGTITFMLRPWNVTSKDLPAMPTVTKKTGTLLAYR